MYDKHRGDIEFLYPNGLFTVFPEAEPVQLYQLYERELRAGRSADLPKADDGFLLFYVLNGEGGLHFADRSLNVRADTVVYSAQTSYTFSVSGDAPMTLVCLNMCMNPRVLSRDLAAVYTCFSHSDGLLAAPDITQLKALITDVIGECCLKRSDPLLIKGQLEQILVATYRACIRCTDEAIFDEPDLHAVGHTVYAIVRYIDENLSSINNLTDMAKELGYSYNYLSHLFRRKTGSTIQAYVSRKKIEKSTALLCDGTLSVTEIAALLNYDCIQSFSKAFKKAMGLSPTEYRAMKGFTDDTL